MSLPVLSVVAATHNEQRWNLHHLIKSIQSSTGGKWVEIVLVDDASASPVCCLPVTLIRNRTRLGVGASRHIGVEAATAPFILLTDAHCVFEDGWIQPT